MKHRMGENSTLNKAYQKFKEAMGYDLGTGRQRERVAARAAFCFVAHKTRMWSTTEIGGVINKDHSTVLFLINKVNDNFYRGIEQYELALTVAANVIKDFSEVNLNEVSARIGFEHLAAIYEKRIKEEQRTIQMLRENLATIELRNEKLLLSAKYAIPRIEKAISDIEYMNSKMSVLGYERIETIGLETSVGNLKNYAYLGNKNRLGGKQKQLQP